MENTNTNTKLPATIGKHKTHTLKLYFKHMELKASLNETFELEALYKYLNEQEQEQSLKYLNKKGYNLTNQTILISC